MKGGNRMKRRITIEQSWFFNVLISTLSLPFVLSCASQSANQGGMTPEVKDAVAQTEKLAASWWEMLMEKNPEWATSVGDHRFDDKLIGSGPESRSKWLTDLKELEQKVLEVESRVDIDAFPDQPFITFHILKREVQGAIERSQLDFDLYGVDQMSGPQASLGYFFSAEHPMSSRKDAENLISRYGEVQRWVEGHLTDLRQGMAKGVVPPKVVVNRVIQQLNTILSQPLSENVFFKVGERVPSSLTEADRKDLQDQIENAAEKKLLAAFQTYRDFLRDELLPVSRDEVGLSSMENGQAHYAHLVRHYTTTNLTPDQIHSLGLKELDRIESAISVLAKERGHSGDARLFVESLKADRANYADSRDDLLASFRVALKRADKVLPEAFGVMPKLSYKVEPMDAGREKDAPAAYYQPGSPKGGRPGIFVANLYGFEGRPLFNSEVLAFHEAVPGHHLQIAISQEIEGVPAFRAEGMTTAYVEGWALYSERLSDELGLYSSLESRVGYLGFAAWRASRLVVDTGLHYKGWTRQHAIDFLAAHTTLGPVDVENEIDRYIVWPGQALAYMVGCLRILNLREHVRANQKADFSLSKFHDVLLGAGPMPLDLLDRHVSRTFGISLPKESL
jgi:uncharacterized protein (DUF885 family)